MTQRLTTLTSVLCLGLLAACGGGSENPDPGSNPGPGTSGAAPDMPSGVAMTVQPNSINVFWTDVPGATTYNVYYDSEPGVDAQSTRIGGSTSPIRISGLTKGTTYYVRLSAQNLAGESPLSAEQEARTTAPPDAVQTFTATPADGGILVSWDAVATATNYTVYASTTAGDVSGATQVATNLTSVTVDGLTNGTTYYVSVRAENIEGDAPRSAEIAATPAAGGAGLGWTQQELINEPYDFFDRDNFLSGVAVNDSGVAAAIWLFLGQGFGNNFVVVNHNTGGAWNEEETLALGDNSTPAVAVTPDGTIVAAWVRHFPDENGFRLGSTIDSRRFENGAWTDVETIANITTPTGEYSGAVTLAADGQGNVLAAWWQDQKTIWVNRFDGSAWGTPELLSTSVRNLGPPALGANAADKGVLAWLQDTQPNDSTETAGGPSERSLFVSNFDGSAWTPGTRVGHMSFVGYEGAEGTVIDVNPEGSAWVAWLQTRDNTNGTGFRVDAQRYDAPGDTWSPPETIVARDWTIGWPDVAIDPAGNAIASWQPIDLADDSSKRVLDASFYDPDTSAWGPFAPVNEDDGVTEPDPLNVEMTADGDVFALWQETDGVYWRRFDAASETWSTIQLLGVRDGASLKMAMSPNGHVVAVTNPLVVNNNRFEYAVYALLYRP